jgi:hypothetical protein
MASHTATDLFGWGARPEIKLTASEFRLQCMVAAVLRQHCLPTWRYTHIPLGEKRDRITAGRLKRMGTTPGWPDLMLIGPGKVCFLELKRRGGRPSAEQEDIAVHVMGCGCAWALATNFDAAIDALKDFGALPMTFHVK